MLSEILLPIVPEPGPARLTSPLHQSGRSRQAASERQHHVDRAEIDRTRYLSRAPCCPSTPTRPRGISASTSRKLILTDPRQCWFGLTKLLRCTLVEIEPFDVEAARFAAPR